MPAWKKVITSGSDASLNTLTTTGTITADTFSGNGSSITNLNASNLSSGTIPDARFPSALPAIDGSALTGISAGGGIFAATGSFQATTNDLQITGSLNIYKSGSTVFNIEGSQGTLFTVTDELSGSLFSVNDISGIPIFEVFSDDTVKIGTFNAEGIVVNGSNVVITGSLAVGALTGSATAGRIDASNDVVAFSTSDRRWKDNITPIESPLQKLLKLGGYEFDWREDSVVHGNKGHDVGVIAQEVESVLPEAVQTRSSGMKAVRYEKIIPLLIETIKEQQKQIDELKNKIG
jgi:hypothetical protein